MVSEIEERLNDLEKEFREAKEELQMILLDIRAMQMEAQSPLPAEAIRGVEKNGSR